METTDKIKSLAELVFRQRGRQLPYNSGQYSRTIVGPSHPYTQDNHELIEGLLNLPTIKELTTAEKNDFLFYLANKTFPMQSGGSLNERDLESLIARGGSRADFVVQCLRRTGKTIPGGIGRFYLQHARHDKPDCLEAAEIIFRETEDFDSLFNVAYTAYNFGYLSNISRRILEYLSRKNPRILESEDNHQKSNEMVLATIKREGLSADEYLNSERILQPGDTAKIILRLFSTIRERDKNLVAGREEKSGVLKKFWEELKTI